MISATTEPWSTSATSTATAPDSVAPTIGMKAPRKTSAASGERERHPEDHQGDADADRVDERHQHGRPHVVRPASPTTPDPASSIRQRASSGNSRTMNRQILRPSRRKKNVAKSTSSAPVSTSNTVAAVASARLVSDDVLSLIHSCACVDVAWLTCASDRCSGPVCSQSWICRTPLRGVLGQLRCTVDELVDHQRQRAGHRGQAADQHHARWPAMRAAGPAAASRRPAPAGTRTAAARSPAG